jgi:steroid 5-alpha reductase family enzyme
MTGGPRHISVAIGVTALSVLLVGLVAWACGTGGVRRWGIPVVWICAALAFLVNWIVFVPSLAARSERYYDLTGSLTYLAAIGAALLLSGAPDARAVLLAGIVTVWAGRLGTFLFRRVRADGGDRRFDALKRSGPRFFTAWTLQAVWVFLTLAAALTAITTSAPVPLGPLAGAGLAVWAAGFAIEVVADRQKRRFRRAKEREAEFISSGLWAWSRHPNYFGEIVLWAGVALLAAPTFRGAQWAALLSPVFVAVLLLRISGVPILEKQADERWGGRPDYERYKAETPVLIPRPPRRR